MSNKEIGIFYGTNTGNTEKISNLLYEKIGKNNTDIFDISNSDINNIKKYNLLLFGISTWFYGEIQYDWESSLRYLKNINFKNKYISFFGCGDQINYPNNFCDAIYYIFNIVNNNNGNIIGYWPNNEYTFNESKSLDKKTNKFIGLIIDEDNQSNKTNYRIDNWLKIIIKESNIKI